MIINYSNQKVIVAKRSIFLAGPTIRENQITEWRIAALKILEKLKYDGVVYVPEYINMQSDLEYMNQVEWERRALEVATIILFWVPRDLNKLPGFTTNVEFGYWIHSKKIVYGRPSNAKKIKYLDWLYHFEYGKRPFDNLEGSIKEAIAMLEQGA